MEVERALAAVGWATSVEKRLEVAVAPATIVFANWAGAACAAPVDSLAVPCLFCAAFQRCYRLEFMALKLAFMLLALPCVWFGVILLL